MGAGGSVSSRSGTSLRVGIDRLGGQPDSRGSGARAKHDAEARRLDGLRRLAEADIVVSSTSAPGFVVTSRPGPGAQGVALSS